LGPDGLRRSQPGLGEPCDERRPLFERCVPLLRRLPSVPRFIPFSFTCSADAPFLPQDLPPSSLRTPSLLSTGATAPCTKVPSLRKLSSSSTTRRTTSSRSTEVALLVAGRAGWKRRGTHTIMMRELLFLSPFLLSTLPFQPINFTRLTKAFLEQHHHRLTCRRRRPPIRLRSLGQSESASRQRFNLVQQ
jgi:hypothetical protein